MKKMNKKLLILVSILLVIGGLSTAYFFVINSLTGSGSNTRGKVAYYENDSSKLILNGELTFNDDEIYPGHKSVSAVSLSAEGDGSLVAYQLIWYGTNTFNSELNFSVYKSDTKITGVQTTCEVVTEVVDGKQHLTDNCTINKDLGELVSTGTIPISENNVGIVILDPGFINASTEAGTTYYYVVIEYPNKEEVQNDDIGEGFSGTLTISSSEVEPDVTIASITLVDLDGNETSSDEFPEKDAYYLDDENSSCTNNVTPIWDDTEWALVLKNLSTNGTRCNLKFKVSTPIITAMVIDNKKINPKIMFQSSKDGTYCINKNSDVNNMNDCIENGNIIKNTVTKTSVITSSDLYYIHIKDSFGNIGISYPMDLSIASSIIVLSNSKKGVDKPNYNKVSYSSCDIENNYQCDKNVGLYCWDVETKQVCTENSRNITYFYRGDVNDNYFKFANHYWRIIRINENGSLRLIYNGKVYDVESAGKETVLANGYNDSSGNYTQIGASMFSEYERVDYLINDNAIYDGDSIIKERLDNWYISNLTNYANYIDKESGFCSEKTINHNLSENLDHADFPSMGYYLAYSRNVARKTPSFECSWGDLYTVENESNKGNGDLTYPIGLITADEIAFAGGSAAVSNDKFYLYTGNQYWTISPWSNFGYVSHHENHIFYWGYTKMDGKFTNTVDPSGIRPVINLSTSGIKLKGNGTISTPYEIAE
ncbi:MAG: hypothetical protein E7163_00665 [Firmicutes bacterium]|nr:hypothetical protein [Bacillota bacterium]